MGGAIDQGGHSRPLSNALHSPRFETRRMLGEGAYGVVYEALDRERGARVAVKALTHCSPAALVSFKHEFRALQDLLHPNLVQLHELIEHEGTWLIVMELVEGADFWEQMRADASSPAANANGTGFYEDRVRDGVLQLADALEALHRAKLVHRDLKPSNIRFTPQGRLLLLDFGLVTELGSSIAPETLATGSAAYMAPEQAYGRVGPAADWYAVGALLYEVLTGTLPFEGSGVDILCAKQRQVPAPPSTLVHGIPGDLDRLCCDLLAVDPEKRPTAAQVRERLTKSTQQTTALHSTVGVGFAGRTQEMAILLAAVELARKGEPRRVLVEGESGVGKTALVEEVLRVLKARADDVLVLAGRCFELEAVPFKGVDGIVDALARHVASLPEADVERLLPRGAALLPRLFPVLGAVPQIGRAVLKQEQGPAALRRAAVDALAEFLERIADRTLLVLVIDDLQWADAETFRLLEELSKRETDSRILWLITSRPLGELEEPAVAWVSKTQTLRGTDVLSLTGLPADEARALAAEMLGDDVDVEWVNAVAETAQGHPLLIGELARYVTVEAPSSAAMLSLEAALDARIREFGADTRELLELVVLAGRPRALSVFAHAMGCAPEQLTSAVGALRGARLLSTGKSGRLRSFHDRVRRAIASVIPPEVARARHASLALALEGQPDGEFHAAVHWERAGDLERAIPMYERSAEAAMRMLAFDRATGLYESLIALGATVMTQARLQAMRVQRARALAEAGRSVLAARACLEALEGATDEERLDLRRRAAQHFLQGAAVREGMQVLTEFAHDLGLGLPTSSKAAFARLIWHRTVLAVRGFETTPRDASEIAPDVLHRLDLLHGLSPALTWIDIFRGAELGARHLRLALASGERKHAMMALASEAGTVAMQSDEVPRRSKELLQRAAEIGRELSDPGPRAFLHLCRGQLLQCQWRVREALPEFERAEQLYCQGQRANWHHSVARTFVLSLLAATGDYVAHAERLDEWMSDARARDDSFASSNFLLMGLGSYRHLRRDRPEAAEKELDEALLLWPAGSAGMPQFGAFFAKASVMAYRDWNAAFDWSHAEFERLSRTPLAFPRFVRATLNVVHAINCMGGAAQHSGFARFEMVRQGRKSAEQASRAHLPTRPLASAVSGMLALLEGDLEGAHTQLTLAVPEVARLGVTQWERQARLAAACCLGAQARDVALEAEAKWLHERGFEEVERALRWLHPVAYAAV